jgi:Domain of unknown function (DUF2017)
MEFYSLSGSRLGLRGIPPLLASLMRQIPRLFEQDWSVAEERLFPSPSHAPHEQTLREDWKAHVEPELHASFLSARQVVEADLRGFQESEGNYTLEFPVAHADSWLNALNQARLCLAAQHHLEEAELSQLGPIAIVSEKDLARLQIHFYAALQQWLVEVVDTA